MTEFKPILGGKYKVTNTGEIWRRTRKLKPGLAKGYEFVTLSEGPLRFRLVVHRAVAALFIGKCPKGKQVNHIDGNKRNNAIENLEYVTLQENVRHSRSSMIGRPGYFKLTAIEVDQIRLGIAANVSGRKLAKQFGVCAGTISQIKRGKSWK